jgi:hypothetical protein
MEREDRPAAGIGFECVGELCDFAGRFIRERQRQPMVRQASGKAVEVFARLRFDAGQCVPLRLGFDRNRSQGGHTRNRKNAEDQFSRDFRCSERLLEYPGSGILRVDDEIHARIFQVA